MKRLIIPIVMAMLFLGCEKDRTKLDTDPLFDGPWNGNLNATGINNHKHNIELIQGAGVLEGSYAMSQATTIVSSGTIAGTYNGNVVDLTYTQTHPCAGTFTFTSDRRGQRMDYTLTGINGCYDVPDGHGSIFAVNPIRF